MTVLAEPIAVALQVGEVLDFLEVRWLVGGSVASSLHGVPRATQDIDLVAELRLHHAAAIADGLADAFFVDADMISDAVRRRASFNLIHLGTMTKVDVFVPKAGRMAALELRRAERHTVPGGGALPLASPEDVILHKLDWFLRSDGSERQWRDVLGIIKVKGARLDVEYLRAHAGDFGVTQLLEDALRHG